MDYHKLLNPLVKLLNPLIFEGQLPRCFPIASERSEFDISGSSSASELKDFMARELQLSPYTFKLRPGGCDALPCPVTFNQVVVT